MHTPYIKQLKRATRLALLAVVVAAPSSVASAAGSADPTSCSQGLEGSCRWDWGSYCYCAPFPFNHYCCVDGPFCPSS